MDFEGVEVDKGGAVGGDDEVDVLEIAMRDAVLFQQGENRENFIDYFCFLYFCDGRVGQIVVEFGAGGQLGDEPGAFEERAGVYFDEADRTRGRDAQQEESVCVDPAVPCPGAFESMPQAVKQAFWVVAFDDIVAAVPVGGGDKAGIAVFEEGGGTGDDVDAVDEAAGGVGSNVVFVENGEISGRFDHAKAISVAQRLFQGGGESNSSARGVVGF